MKRYDAALDGAQIMAAINQGIKLVGKYITLK